MGGGDRQSDHAMGGGGVRIGSRPLADCVQ